MSRVVERSRDRSGDPSTRNGTIASSTVTAATVSSARWGFVTRTLISPGLNSIRLISN